MPWCAPALLEGFRYFFVSNFFFSTNGLRKWDEGG